MTFQDFYNFCDALIAENFEGNKPRGDITGDQWYYVRATSFYSAAVPMDDHGRTLFSTKLLRKPLAAME